MTVSVLTLEAGDERVSVPQAADHGPAFRSMLAELGLDVGRLLRIMVALGDPRPRDDLALLLAGQITGRFPVAPEMLCLLRALGCLQPLLAPADAPDRGGALGAWAAASAG